MNSCLLIIVHVHLSNLTTLLLLKELFYPHKFTSVVLYSTSAPSCFLFLLETILPPMKTQYLALDCLSIGDFKITIPHHLSISLIYIYIIPCPRVFFMYTRMWITTFQWSRRGACIKWLTTPTSKRQVSLIIVR